MSDNAQNRLVSKKYGDLGLTLAQIHSREGESWSSVLAPGLWCGIVSQGSLDIDCKLYDGGIPHKTALNFYIRDPLEVNHIPHRDCRLDAVFVHLPLDLIEPALGPDWTRSVAPGADSIRLRHESRILNALSLQMLTAPISGGASEFYVAGKAFEFFSLSLTDQSPGSVVSDLHRHAELRAGELDRVHLAREILLSSLEDPLTIPDLAKRVGFSVNRLRGTFQTVFGETISVHLRNARLDAAKALIETSGCSVAEAACKYGFGIAHFSTVFRNRFGFSPSFLRRGKRT